MGKTVVVADAHIRDNNTNLTSFLELLQSIERDGEVERVILLGDIFDFYCDNKRKLSPAVTTLISAIERCGEKCETILVEGNHEFGIRLRKIQVFKRFFSYRENGRRFFFSHGDEFASFQPHIPFIRAFFHMSLLSSIACNLVPNKLIWSIAVKISQKSRSSGKIDGNTINRRLAKFFSVTDNGDIVIFAHSHRRFVKRSGKKIIVGIGAWYENLHYAIIDKERIVLKKWVGK